MNRIIAAALLFIFIFLLVFLLSCSDHDLNQAVDQTEETFGPPQENSVQVELDETLHLPIIGIYSNEGSWPENVTALKNFLAEYGFLWQEFNSENAVSDELYSEVDMIIFPGGFATEYRYAIKDHDIIRSFVESGGLYVGICAGAYYAADIFKWQGTAYDFPLSLFPGTAAGPLSGILNWGDVAELTLNRKAAPNEGFSDQIWVYYFDGPYYTFHLDNDESVDVLARYSSNNEAAVIAGTFGAGRYLLLGPHPELGRYDPETPGPNTIGEDGAQWPWFYSLLLWLHHSSRG